MADPVRVLLKTTIPTTEDDWHIGRFSLLAAHLASLREGRAPLYDVTAHDRTVDHEGNDVDLAAAASGGFDQIWLIATDVTGALTPGDVEHIAAFRSREGGLFLTRDHQDLGACLSRLGSVGATQHFQSINPEADEARRCCDDVETPTITWPNYHSGANGDLQIIEVIEQTHPLVRRPGGGAIERLPAHPHEGAVGVPESLKDVARVVARGRSRRTGAPFDLCVAVEEPGAGRAVSDSSFHHLADYNWNPRLGAPSFVDEPAGDQVLREPSGLDDVHAYVANIAAWLAGRN